MSTADDSNDPSSSMDTPSEVAASFATSNDDDESCDLLYKYLILDSGPIVRLTGLSSLRNKARHYVTVPAVLEEIRDAHARQHLKQLPFELQTREASPEGIAAMVEFARQTGDYASLSAVDLQVLGLLYDLEKEATEGNMDHVRKTPKRTLGVGRIEALSKNAAKNKEGEESNPQESSSCTSIDQVSNPTAVTEKGKSDKEAAGAPPKPPTDSASPQTPRTWAMLVNPSTAATSPPSVEEKGEEPKIADKTLNVAFGSMNLSDNNNNNNNNNDAEFVSGQFSDAEEDDESTSNSDGDGDKEVSDEECNVHVMDPDEAEKSKHHDEHVDFPSLAEAMLHVHYEASDEEKTPAVLAKEQAEQKRARALEPMTKSGKLYNSFRRYGNIVKPKKGFASGDEEPYYTSGVETVTPDITTDDDETASETPVERSSRIMGGMTMSGQATQVEDDGEGWITCASDIKTLKSVGTLDPLSTARNSNNLNLAFDGPKGPPMSKRAACATTDFAMQNVILQMNLELLSVDGIKVRRLKSWVTRCGACFTVHADGNNVGPHNMKRLFCSRCGSDMMQRVAASVDGKTGRLRLHLSKKYKNNLRGTKYSLPKAGTNNRFQGDLLLREDQLMMGAWNQKVKKRSGGKARSSAQSMFGSDLASHVGCHADLIKRDDIKAGFGRRNPNAAKGRERRGKKKKSSDKACGLRRY